MGYFAIFIFFIISYCFSEGINHDEDGFCSIDSRSQCEQPNRSGKYEQSSHKIISQIENAFEKYKYEPCSNIDDDSQCKCHENSLKRDLQPFSSISKKMVDDASKYGTRYKIMNHRLFRDHNCMFPARCSGVEHFLLRLLPGLPNIDMVINTRDYPQVPNHSGSHEIPVFSFSKTNDYNDIRYPAWSFWSGGPAISLFPTGIGRWDLLRVGIENAGNDIPWSEKETKAFFRGSRTSSERDSLILLSRRKPDLVNARYTKNQAWKSKKDTLNAEPAEEVSFEEHCNYKYLFNFRGVAASFRFKHLFLCQSLVFHVGDEWNEFFYDTMKPWVHYIPVKSKPSQDELEEIINFFKEHDNLAQQISKSGYKFIKEHLRMNDVECYWKKLLNEYSKLLNYKVDNVDNLKEIRTK